MTIREALESAALQLREAEIETPMLDSRLLLAWVLKARREDLIREPERELTHREELIFHKAIALRALRRPLPYLTGEGWFYGRPFKVNRAVLIPRPETEILVEKALSLLHEVPHPAIADIGTGSGCIAVTCALERPDSSLWATDISKEALQITQKNIMRYQLSGRITPAHGSLFGPLPPNIQFDLIISNPPYIPQQLIAALQPEVRDYEPLVALSGLDHAAGDDGTHLHQRLLDKASAYLKNKKWIIMEVGEGQALSVAAYASAVGYTEVDITKDYSGIGRVVSARTL